MGFFTFIQTGGQRASLDKDDARLLAAAGHQRGVKLATLQPHCNTTPGKTQVKNCKKIKSSDLRAQAARQAAAYALQGDNAGRRSAFVRGGVA